MVIIYQMKLFIKTKNNYMEQFRLLIEFLVTFPFTSFLTFVGSFFVYPLIAIILGAPLGGLRGLVKFNWKNGKKD
jgi:hypothetical protein